MRFFAALSVAFLFSALYLQPSLAGQGGSHVEVIEVQPATTYFTTRVQKVPNKTKYPKYTPPTVLPQNQHVIPQKPPTVLTGQVGADDNLDDGINRGVGDVANDLLKQAPTLGRVKRVHLTSDVFQNWMKQNWPNLNVTNLKPQDTVVVKGRYDHAEHVLDSCRIPYVNGDNSNLPKRLANATLLVINCPGELTDESIAVIRQYLNNGGYLLTTDWSLSGCLQKICPGYVYWDGAYSTNEIVDGIVVIPESNLVKGASPVGPWKLDDKSELVKPGARKSLQVLARSRTLSYQDTVGLGVLALTFDYGAGHVLHTIGHVDNNTDLASQSVLPDPSPQTTVSLRQVISLNFIMNALSHRK
ncbi:MAG: hypothetical protein JST89_18860 [Cyanobacteria bacterium SZAS-4]|nr:hypothetical protein [Cyanobacteria bacterium SZAS-4]